MVDQEEIAEGPFEVSFITDARGGGEEKKWDFSEEGGLSGMSVLLKDGTLLIRLSPGALKLLDDGGTVNTEVPGGAKKVRIDCLEDVSFPDDAKSPD